MKKSSESFRIIGRVSEVDAERAQFAALLELTSDVQELLEFAADLLPAAPCRCIDATCNSCRVAEIVHRRTGCHRPAETATGCPDF